MLVPLTQRKFEDLVPLVATGPQYVYYWGDWQNVVKQVLFSLLGALIVWFLSGFLESSGLALFLGIIAGLYWLWGPVAKASLRNARYRRYPYSGFWQGKILDVYVTEEVVGTEETTNARGELVLVENRERRLNVEIGDKNGFLADVQVPLRRQHQFLAPGQTVQTLVLSEDRDLRRISKITDLYVPSRKLWVSDYPVLEREGFVEVSRRLGRGTTPRNAAPRQRPPLRRSRSRSQERQAQGDRHFDRDSY
ncbi:phosphate ABC transporter permease [Baaleninema sp.]|uniref:phosphate ABC transporter permease n=1 Tax=Baaleninema sp. TaxID=3101197 RepID=UPI003CFE4EC6